MGFLDELKKLTKPYADDEDDFDEYDDETLEEEEEEPAPRAARRTTSHEPAFTSATSVDTAGTPTTVW